MNFKLFKETVVKIDFQESRNEFGHYPFQLATIKNKQNTLCALDLNRLSDIKKVYFDYVNDGSDEIFLSLDFPSTKIINSDHVIVLHYKNKKIIEAVILEYDVVSGEITRESDGLTNDELVKNVLSQFE